jgi:hypothetical protein
VVRSPTSPQKLAGARIEPPVSDPVAMSTKPPETAAAEPDDEPPVTRPGAFGLTGKGKCAFWPISENANSSVCVLPAKRAPASSSICTAGAVFPAGGLSAARSGLPQPVTIPATSKISFTPSDSRASGPLSAFATACGRSRKAFSASRIRGIVHDPDTVATPLFDGMDLASAPPRSDVHRVGTRSAGFAFS